jgi:hypothetical protein
VRKEALRSLSWATRNDATRRRVLALARGSGEAEALRAMAFKALWPVAATDYEVKGALLDALRSGGEESVRAAAAWTLFASEQHYDARRALVDAARDASSPLGVRIEAVKSLLIPMIHYEVNRPVMQMAASPAEPDALREAAVMALLGANDDYEVRGFLERTARAEASTALRAAAVLALGPLDLERARYFHLAYYRQNGRVIPLDPLEGE